MSKIEIASLPPVINFLMREDAVYATHRQWGGFDTLKVRSLDDLCFASDDDSGAVYGFSSEPPHGEGCVCVALPLQIALERIYFHASEPERLVLNPRGPQHHAAAQQQQLDFSIPNDFDPEIVILRDEIPLVLGELAVGGALPRDLESGAHKALSNGLFFESFFLGHTARVAEPTNATGWFFELFAFSFFGKPDDVLALYEEYPERGSANPHAQLLDARYRLLLNQLNEARTILHTLTYDQQAVGALASCELARSFLKDKQYARALDGASAAISKDSQLIESYLIRGMAQRGISYEAGDREGLEQAYKDFEKVAKHGGYNAAEALYHAGTVCARLGALAQAEELFRKSLFQRGRISPRDALIRVLCAQGEKGAEAKSEFEILKRVAPKYVASVPDLESTVRVQIDKTPEAVKPKQATDTSSLWGTNYEESVRAARELLGVWGVPLRRDLSDCGVLDDFINHFAPDGDFPRAGRCSELATAGHDIVARVFALHIAGLLVESNGAVWAEATERDVTVVSKRDEIKIPLEKFVKDRVLLGASGDNFSSLESLVVEVTRTMPDSKRFVGGDWWSVADDATLDRYRREVAWAKDILTRAGVQLTGTLLDLERLDRWIDEAFEPGGGVSEAAQKILGRDIDRCIAALGLFIGENIASRIPSVWFSHDRAEGISIVSGDLGRLFPVARLQRRVYLASAADFSTKLSSLAWSAAVAATTEKVRSGALAGHAEVKQSLLTELPSIATFPDHELAGVVESLLIGASLATR